ncbi:MAG: hypothetical protein AB7V77_00630 [Candidatus Woesearchaeota archaeon]
MNKLFVCNQNLNRSVLAEKLFGGRSKGLFRNEVTSKDLEWADVVYVFEDFQIGEIAKRFPKEYLSLKIVNLDIFDVYNIRNEKSKEELEIILKEKMKNENK